jgi:hypothetical protein
MNLNDRKDHFSRAVVRAVAATAGVPATVPEHDHGSRDITFQAVDTQEAVGRALDAQLKCTAGVDTSGDDFSFDLPVHNYQALRKVPRMVPIILVVVVVPDDPDTWVTLDSEQMVLRKCAYWQSLSGFPETDNTSTVAVKIPTSQVFDCNALHANLAEPGEDL